MEKMHADAPHPLSPGVAEVKSFEIILIYIATLRKLLELRKEMERKAAPRIKRIMQWLHLGGYTPKVKRLHTSISEAEMVILHKALELIRERQSAYYQWRYSSTEEERIEFISKTEAFNLFRLGVTAFDANLGAQLEVQDKLSAMADGLFTQNQLTNPLF